MADNKNHLYYGDNLAILRDRIADESVDLIYLDPPFNSNATYNVLFKSHDGAEAAAQIEAFDDTWHWSQQTDDLLDSMIGGGAPNRVADALSAMRNLLGTSDVNAYLVMMTARLVELHRVLKPTGSLYLHCDPTASHYLKIMLDAVFGPERFLGEIIWKRTSAHNRTSRFGPVHDVVLVYSRGKDWTWNPQFVPYDQEYIDRDYRRVEDGTNRRFRISDVTSNNPGSSYEWNGKPPPGNRYWAYSKERMEQFEQEGRLVYSSNGYPQYKRYLDEMPGQMVQDVWTDIGPINNRAAERLGYPTQKPLALLERIIQASSDPDDVVLDPFCGCGTAIDAAQKLGRRWVGIDVTYLAVDLIRNRLRHTYGFDLEKSYEIHGIPRDFDGARALFKENPFDFERWVVSLIDGTPNEKQVGDKGIDGRVRFYADEKRIGQVLVSVKGGKSLNPGMVRDLVGTVQRENAEMGLLITLTKPTDGMIQEAKTSGTYVSPLTGQTYPKVQIVSTADLMAHKKPIMPSAILPYIKATPRKQGEQLKLE